MDFNKMRYPQIKQLILTHLGQIALDAFNQFESADGRQKIIAYLNLKKQEDEYKKRCENTADIESWYKEVEAFNTQIRHLFFNKLESAINSKKDR